MSELTGLSGIIPTYRPNRAFAPETGRSCQTRQTIHYGIIKQHVRLSRRIGLNRDLRGLIRTCPTVSPQIGLFRIFQVFPTFPIYASLSSFVPSCRECLTYLICPVLGSFARNASFVVFCPGSSGLSQMSVLPCLVLNDQLHPGVCRGPNTNNATADQDQLHPPFRHTLGGRKADDKPNLMRISHDNLDIGNLALYRNKVRLSSTSRTCPIYGEI
jgi:hypothetical protein